VNNSRERPSKPSRPSGSRSGHEALAALGAGLPTPPFRPTEGLHEVVGRPTVALSAGSGDPRTARQPVIAPSRFRNPEPGHEPNGLPRLPCRAMLFITLNLRCAFDPQAVCDTFSERKL
jgi:hypothetical protein